MGCEEKAEYIITEAAVNKMGISVHKEVQVVRV